MGAIPATLECKKRRPPVITNPHADNEVAACFQDRTLGGRAEAPSLHAKPRERTERQRIGPRSSINIEAASRWTIDIGAPRPEPIDSTRWGS